MNSLINKYNVPGPRYTSYPTVPFWNQAYFSSNKWIARLQQNFDLTNSTEGISLYIHLPYCESLCTFCGCHKHITKQHKVEQPYIDAVLKEWNLYLNLFGSKPIIKELHLGGGTPTFFSSTELKRLVDGIFEKSVKHEHLEMSFEGHPNNTSETHLQVLFDLGFKRVSFGVQDYDEKVQKAIHRNQAFNQVSAVSLKAREIGYQSITHDIIYGLPFQTIESIKDTIYKTAQIMPDRISFYSYAHVPWMKGNGQRGFKNHDLPKSEYKRQLYEEGRTLLQQFGYYEIGMDHFAKATDDLYKSSKNKQLHRNFMGYTPSKTTVLIGLGASAISDCGNAFAQNEKQIPLYLASIERNEIPVFKGHVLSNDDLVLRHCITDIICRYSTDLTAVYAIIPKEELQNRLNEFLNDELITIENNQLTVTHLGKTFVRNICMAFDEYLIQNTPSTQLFSMTI
ncbi:oxygen-independent coproporphyrinogen III oxidase [Flavobacterium sp. CBA20B-1]|uniref:oxygen-independent coproporphyrinogen III oxidase n=1 Tax=unclassified Flavobacterium TaxID=196869 RepID=UPI002225957C|nr:MULTISPECIES: oxygen-independent coproporphyrinogen III oxidase [unclassified Flavobacterium]WCM42830.1 oxygen-independent coproporphyrinogen III oxidase [Flavobacterium sp. CBA20B-1]